MHLGYYGHDLGGEATISSLLRELVKIEGLQRIRLSSLEPTEITTELVDLMLEEEKNCRHLHLPLQSGDDFILKQMNRRYSVAEFLHLVMWLRSRIPNIALTTDVMVGFPQEAEVHFNNTVRVVREAAFSRLHVFKYSPRRGTPAASFPGQVPAKEKEKRSRRLIAVGRELAADYHRKFIGKKVDVLFESRRIKLPALPNIMSVSALQARRNFSANHAGCCHCRLRGRPRRTIEILDNAVLLFCLCLPFSWKIRTYFVRRRIALN